VTVALVTGASSGLGAEYARQLAARGADLVLVARSRDALEALAGELATRYGTRVEVLPADLTDAAALAEVERRLADRERPIEVLVNNAGTGLPLAFERNPIDDEVAHLRLHVEAAMRLTHAVLNGMLERGHGRIVNISSVAAFIPRSTYSAAKAWLLMFSRWANAQYSPRGVTVTAVCPGFTHTNFHERMGLPPGQEGVPGWMWLDARDVVATSLRDAARGRSVSIPSLRYKVLARLAPLVPDRATSRAARRGR
jgi:short-subunit dehydrogenase